VRAATGRPGEYSGSLLLSRKKQNSNEEVKQKGFGCEESGGRRGRAAMAAGVRMPRRAAPGPSDTGRVALLRQLSPLFLRLFQKSPNVFEGWAEKSKTEPSRQCAARRGGGNPAIAGEASSFFLFKEQPEFKRRNKSKRGRT